MQAWYKLNSDKRSKKCLKGQGGGQFPKIKGQRFSKGQRDLGSCVRLRLVKCVRKGPGYARKELIQHVCPKSEGKNVYSCLFRTATLKGGYSCSW